MRRQVGPLHRYAVQAADLAGLAVEEGPLDATTADVTADQVKLAVEERVVGVGYPETPIGVGRNWP